MRSGLPTKPLEFSDFSGGITDNIVQGDPRRYAEGDNFFITVDHKLEERPGILPESESSYYITGAVGQRINNYHLVINDTVRMPQVSRNLYYLNDASVWTEILGVAGNPALSDGDSNSQTTFSEFQKVLYFATDGDLPNTGVQPSKVYQDEDNLWVAKTAGLPRAYVPGNYTDLSLLQKCITNANALRTSFIAHFNDAKYPVYQTPSTNEISPGDLHINIDRYALSYFQSVVFGTDPNVPVPLPTPQGNATDQATLFLLVNALNLAYSEHVTDAMKNSWGSLKGPASLVPIARPVYHQDPAPYTYLGVSTDYPLQKTKGPGAKLKQLTTPTTVEQAAAMLDDLLQKWKWHQGAVNTHDYQNDPAVFQRYAPSCTAVGTIQIGDESFPTITSDWGDVIGFANNLKYLYNSHLTVAGAGGGHKMRDNFIYNMGLECRLPNATDLDSTYLLIYWVRSLYQLHYYDASVISGYLGLTFTNTSGTNALTTVVQTSTNVAYNGTFVTGAFLEYFNNNWNPQANKNNQLNATPQYTTARVTSGGAGTLNLDSTTLTGGLLNQGQISSSMYHRNGANSGNTLADTQGVSSTTSEILANDVTSVGVDATSWILLGSDVFYAMSSHMTNQVSHLINVTVGYNSWIGSVPSDPFFIPDTIFVSYALYFQDEYVVNQNGVEYLVRSNPVLSASTEVAVSYPVGTIPTNLYPAVYTQKPIVTTRANTLSGLPVLVNNFSSNYDTSNVKLEIYRTTDGGNTYFELTEVNNGTLVYVDTTNDTLTGTNGSNPLNKNPTIYTSGGVVGDDQPPMCKYTHSLNGFVYWGAVQDGDQFFPNRVRQSKQNQPDSAPATFFDDFDSPVMGLSSSRNNMIALCKTSIYRMNGAFNSQGQGQMTHENISDTLGCLNAKGIVRTEIGVFFPGTDGFYYTDGYQIINITLELKETYAALTKSASQQRSIYGAYDKVQRRIWWLMKESENDSDNSVAFVFYLNFGVKPSGVFTTVSNGLNFRPSSMTIQNGIVYVTHEKGYLLKLDPLNKWDAFVDPDADGGDWIHTVIPYNYVSIAVDLGTTFQRKWLTKIHIVGKNEGNQGMQPYAIRDLNEYDQGAVPLAPINYIQNFTWGVVDWFWGDDTCVWKTDGKMDLWRRFPRGQLRSDFMQVQFKPAYLSVYASSVGYPFGCFARVVSGTTTKAIDILTPSGYTDVWWPSDVIGYELALSFDGYETKFPITLRPGENQIEISDPQQILSVGATTFEWEIWGLKKEQRVNLSSFVLHFAYLGDENQNYPGAYSSDGPGNAGQNPS